MLGKDAIGTQIRSTLVLLKQSPAWQDVLTAHEGFDPDMLEPILDMAARLTEDVFVPLDEVADKIGCQVVDGRVMVPEAYHAAWAGLADGGWIGLDLPEALGGSGLPLPVQVAVQTVFDRGCPAFNMAWGANRSASVLLVDHAPTQAVEWVPKLLSGQAAATICISEADAGSDLGRMRSSAHAEDGRWFISGQKCWISFGDHDMTDTIFHCVLARTSNEPGTRGISLFLVPSRPQAGRENGIRLGRIEETLGLHGSPTCVLDFEKAEGILIGEPGRGLPQLFTMIELMRLQTGCQGLGAASRACDLAETYADTRLQGGDPRARPVAISSHPDVRRQLARMRSATEILRTAVLELSAILELSRDKPDGEEAAIASYLMPQIKTFGAETGFEAANAAVQVLGGAGYTREWPAERIMRDSRILSIFEGTTGMQALDFLERRLVRDRRGFTAFLARARRECGPNEILDRFEQLGERLAGCAETEARLACADAWLRAGWIATIVWLSPRLAAIDPHLPTQATAQISERLAVLEGEVDSAIS